MKMLLEAGACVNAPTWTGKTPLFYAAVAGHATAVRMLLQAGADPNQSASAYFMILEPSSRGVQSKCLSVATCCLVYCIWLQPTIIPDSVGSLLAYAVHEGHVEVSRILLDHGAIPDDRFGDAPLLVWSAACGNVELTALLIARHADVQARTSATISKFTNVLGVQAASRLLHHQDGSENKAALDLAKEGLRPDATAIANAVYFGHFEVVRQLLEGGALCNLGEALQVAEDRGHSEITNELEKAMVSREVATATVATAGSVSRDTAVVVMDTDARRQAHAADPFRRPERDDREAGRLSWCCHDS